MAPSSARRQSARKRQPSARQRGQNAPASSSPSRPSKRRKVNAAPTPAEPEADPMEDVADDETSDDEQLNPPPDPADKVIEYLEEAKDTSNVAKEHGNEINANRPVSAYAKVAGRTWTYYVRDPRINIGRRPDAKATPSGSRQTEAPTHIDLGPSKHVSRLHATLFYEDDLWILEVGGRNGVRVDDGLLRKGQRAALRSGNVLKIDETEMIFVLPGVESEVHEQYLNRLAQPPKAREGGEAHTYAQGHPIAQQFQPPAHISPYANVNGNHEGQGSGSNQRQTTPVNAIMQAPYLSQNATAPAQPSTTPQRGGPPVVMENSEHQIDYSDESMKDVKPPMSYATLIAQAILAGPSEKSSLNGIYEWIKTNFAYYRFLEAGWQNSIRHNLSLNQAFHRVGRDTHEPGKGGLWYIAEDRVEEFRKQGLKMTSRGGARQSNSNPSSPVPKRSPRKKTPPRRAAHAPGASSSGKEAAGPESSKTTSTGSSNAPQQQTPSRPSRGPASALTNAQLPQLSSDASPLPSRPSYMSQNAQATDSPTTLTSSQFFGHDGIDSSIFTPAPQRHEPRLMAPSTAKLPSKYLPQSSPAPFWKNVGATPSMNLPETSPMKADPDQTQLLNLQSSSPPPPSANGSPTRARVKGDMNAPPPPIPQFRRSPANAESAPSAKHNANAEDEDEEEQLDLMGNFPKIGENAVSSATR